MLTVARHLRERRDELDEDQILVLEHLLDHARSIGAWDGDEYGHPIIAVPMPPREMSQMLGMSMEEAWESRQALVEQELIRCHVPGRPIGEPGWEDDGGAYELLPPPGVQVSDFYP